MDVMFFEAAQRGQVEDLKEILSHNPNLNVNWRNSQFGGFTALTVACDYGHDSIVSILLAHPRINVNPKDENGWTPFLATCVDGRTSCARLLLKDSRVKVNQPKNDGDTPLRWAAFQGHLDIIKWWIASGREMNLGKPGLYWSDAIGVAKERGETEVATLLERFKENPVETRYQVRMDLCLVDEMAAEIFALVVFVSDGLLQVTQGDQSTLTFAVRFFSIASQLPLELQMVLCYQVVCSGKETILGKDSEVAFRELAKRI